MTITSSSSLSLSWCLLLVAKKDKSALATLPNKNIAPIQKPKQARKKDKIICWMLGGRGTGLGGCGKQKFYAAAYCDDCIGVRAGGTHTPAARDSMFSPLAETGLLWFSTETWNRSPTPPPSFLTGGNFALFFLSLTTHTHLKCVFRVNEELGCQISWKFKVFFNYLGKQK